MPILSSLRIAGVLLIFPMMPGVALAQSQQTPSREGNIWGGAVHDPNPKIVGPEERAAGVAPSPHQQEKIDKKEDRLYQELMTTAPNSHASE
jgi:hypothetical protein